MTEARTVQTRPFLMAMHGQRNITLNRQGKDHLASSRPLDVSVPHGTTGSLPGSPIQDCSDMFHLLSLSSRSSNHMLV